MTAVLVLTPDFPPAFGGIQRLVDRLVTHLDRCDVNVVALGSRSDDGIRRVPRPPLGGQAAAIALLNAAGLVHALRIRPDVVLSAHISVSPAARAIKRLTSAPYVQYVYAMEVSARPRLAVAALRSAAAIVAISRYTGELAMAHGGDPAKLRHIPPGVDLPRCAEEPPFETPTIVSVSRLDERYKGHDVLLRALPLIRARVPAARLVVIGDGPLRPAYEGLAHSLSVDGAVQFLGAVDDDERDRVLSRSHVFALPSRLSATGAGEGFGIVFLEAAAHGLPVVAGKVAGALDAVVDGKTGLLVDPSDHLALADAVSHLLLDTETAEALGRAGAQRAEQFAWPALGMRAEDVLIDVAERRKSAAASLS
jgi:phosphatidylinositol alpha-1,6-mannosyltransferase